MGAWEGNHFLNPERSFKIKINANRDKRKASSVCFHCPCLFSQSELGLSSTVCSPRALSDRLTTLPFLISISEL